MNEEWDRRRFLKRLGIAGGAAACSTGIGLIAHKSGEDAAADTAPKKRSWDFRAHIPSEPPTVAVGQGGPAEAVRAAIEGLGGMKRYIQKGETVAIKPNVGWDRTPIQAADTNPKVVATLVELCLEAGASRVVVTDNSCNDPKRCFTRSGIWKSVEKAGGEIVLPDEHRFEVLDLGGVLGTIPVLLPAVEADRLINAPIAKQHSLSGFTGGLKNLYGVLGGRRNRLHQKINESIADLACLIRPTLTVMDAVRVLFRNGPQGGDIKDTREVNEVIVSEDPTAVDAYACTLIGMAPKDLPYLKIAAERGVGTVDPAQIEKRLKRF
jgi:uncharacterized protein (DUF362 family)